jgi:pyruvate/2-oxoglutarate dehydrogenase complex dihydrolipoamide dehydrogenase (E3) component
MDRIEADVCVIGAGSGGLSVAAGAAQMGARVVLIEGHRMGGDCLNFGCVPSKALLSAAARGAGWADAQANVARAIAAIEPHDSQERFEGLGVRVIRAFGRFTGPDTVQAGEALIRARRFVIATGSSPAIPPIPGIGLVPVLTNETVFDLPEPPGHLLILGAGPIGMEMAQAHRRLGCRVTVIEGARALGRDDPEAAALVTDALRAEGVQIVEGARVERIGGRPGAIEVQVAGGSVFMGTHLLVAAGRRPNLDRLDLAAAGIAATAQGVTVDSGLRTTNRRVFAIGDAAGRGQFTHLAGYHAGLVVRSALLALPVRLRDDHIPRVTYTAPELAQIGLTEAEARSRHGAGLEVIRLGYDANDRAQAEGRTEGWLKLMVHRSRPVGVTLVGPGAGEQIALWAVVFANRLKLSALAGTVLPYPTRAELSKRAVGAYFAPRLFDNAFVKRVVRWVQSYLP